MARAIVGHGYRPATRHARLPSHTHAPRYVRFAVVAASVLPPSRRPSPRSTRPIVSRASTGSVNECLSSHAFHRVSAASAWEAAPPSEVAELSSAFFVNSCTVGVRSLRVASQRDCRTRNESVVEAESGVVTFSRLPRARSRLPSGILADQARSRVSRSCLPVASWPEGFDAGAGASDSGEG